VTRVENIEKVSNLLNFKYIKILCNYFVYVSQCC